MKYTAALALAAAVGVSAQGAAPGLKPSGSPPPGCQTTVSGRYAVQNVAASPSKRSLLEKRLVDCSAPGTLVVQISNSVMTDSAGRIAEIVANRQFQFDGPPAQTGSIYDAGWSMCSNGSLAIGSTTVFYQCLSGSFYNLYDQPVGAGCMEIHQQLMQCADSTGATTAVSATSAASVSTMSSMMSSSSAAPTTVMSSTMSSSAATLVSQTTDGQPQATSASNATVTTKAPVPTGGATQFVASGAVVALGAMAAFLL